MTVVSYLECTKCGEHFSAAPDLTTCPHDGAALTAGYDLTSLRSKVTPDNFATSLPSMFRYSALLPRAEALTLAEGFTPLRPVSEYSNFFVKDESRNPSMSSAARGMSVAIGVALAQGIKGLELKMENESAKAFAVYAAAAGMEARVLVSADDVETVAAECSVFGARVTSADLPDSDSRSRGDTGQAWRDISAFKEPYRIEGAKTIAFEIAEKFSWVAPSAVICPVGSGLDVVGIWKGFNELRALGITKKCPKMMAVGIGSGGWGVSSFSNAASANQLLTGWPSVNAVGAPLVVKALEESSGIAAGVASDEADAAQQGFARREGLLLARDSAAGVVLYRRLLADRVVSKSDNIVVINTASGFRTTPIAPHTPARRLPVSRQIGGIIGPY